jgi:hypothetical protein
MPDDPKKLQAAFYRSEPVRDWLRALSVADRRVLGYDIGLVEFGWPVGMPTHGTWTLGDPQYPRR